MIVDLRRGSKILAMRRVLRGLSQRTDTLEIHEDAIEEGDGKLALALLKELGALRSGGEGAGFETADLGAAMPKIVINISGHSSDDSARIIDVESEES